MITPFLLELYRPAREHLLAALQKVVAEKKISSIKDLHLLSDVYHNYFEEALHRRQLLPYTEDMNIALAAFGNKERALQEMYSSVSYSCKMRTISSLDNFFETSQARLTSQKKRFHRLHGLAERHIQLEVIPTPALDGRKVLLPSTKVIVPAEIHGDLGYHVYALFYSFPRKEPLPDEASPESQPPTTGEKMAKMSRRAYPPVDIEQLTDTPCFSLEDALDRYTHPQDVCTIAFAQNAEHFPLAETALPIVVEKYLAAVHPASEKSPE
ncbi:MAG: hypothetical protein Q8R53_02425 [Nanoarchaeota archaeon]|nr:hypothetical protein [Nanoarchaeota archaeon]